MGHPQPATPLQTDNEMANNFTHANLRQRRSKTWDMQLNWQRDKKAHNEFNIYWDKGKNNQANYFTKHHPPKHHREQRPKYILKGYHVQQLKDNYTILSETISKIIRKLPLTAREGVFRP